MRANDNIPADEMLLAEAISAARSRSLRWTSGKAFKSHGRPSSMSSATHCCALGALAMAGLITVDDAKSALGRRLSAVPLDTGNVFIGNDRDREWSLFSDDRGESLGWAFRCAMTQEHA